MNEPFVQLSAGDFPELMNFLSRCFAKPTPDWFHTHLPGIYQPTDRHTRCNYAIRRGGTIACVIGLFPITLRIASSTLRVAGIGGVSTDPQYRGQGLMSHLMKHVLEEIHREGYDLSWLGGLRHRYRYFGWERVGSTRAFHAGPSVVEWWQEEHDVPEVKLEQVPVDGALMAKLQALQETQLVHCQRPAEDFGRLLWTRQFLPRAAWDEGGELLGYVAGREGGGEASLVARDAGAAVAITCAWVKACGAGVAIQWHTLPDPMGRALGEMSESVSTSVSGNWQIFNWPKVVDTLLRERHAASKLAAGSVTVGISGTNQVLRLTVDGATAKCEVSPDKPDVTADAMTTMRLLFGPAAPSGVLPLEGNATILDAWCPLPLWLPAEDHV